jgi:tetratricopeptide (TPR) repeat protein
MRGFRAAGAVVIALCAATALAGATGKEKEKDKKDAKGAKGPTPLMAAVADGNTKFAAKDFPAAIEAYKKAVQVAPTDPLGHYLVAEAQLAQGNIADAQTALSAAEKVGDKRPDVMGKVLFLEADVKEREKKWADAKTAWGRYNEWASKHGDSGAMPATATARVQAIEDWTKLDTTYDDVRKRIAAEKTDGGK